jgi:sepiapterin reductase
MTKSALVVTGASRGFGQAIATTLCSTDALDITHLYLTARNTDGLAATSDLVRSTGQTHSGLEIRHLKMDLANLESLEAQMESLLALLTQDGPFDRLYVVLNAGSLGPLVPVADLPLSDIAAAINLNVSSFLFTSATFLRSLSSLVTSTSGSTVRLVNISSLLAVKAFPTFGLYAVGKAARDMAMQAIAAENPGPMVKTLSYAPGPLETDMMSEILGSPTIDPVVKQSFVEMEQKKVILGVAQSAKRLASLLVKDAYDSGSHVDYFDLPNDE